MITPSEPSALPPPRAARERLTATLSAELVTAWSRLAVAAASARGRHHRVNEDSHSALDGIAPVFVVADGVGGGAMASWASRQLVTRLHRRLDRVRIDADAIREALLDADRSIAKGIAQHSGTSGAATVALAAGSGTLRSRWWIAWVGDCRVYRIRMICDEQAQLLTGDDTYRRLSEDPPPGGSLDDPARMIGNGAVSAPNIERADLDLNEMLLLCSDGVHKYVDSREIAEVMRDAAPLPRRCLRLVEVARLNGGQDDATVLAVLRHRPRSRFARYASGVLFALAAALLILMWPDTSTSWQSESPPPSSRLQPESAP
jgi:serine/threonine protein phosphatase PrpC